MRKFHIGAGVFAAALLAVGVAPAVADVVVYSDTNVGGPDWARPFADGTCCSGLGPVKYSVQPFTVSAAGMCSFSSVQAGYDGYMFLYTDPFDPTNQTVNFVAGDDDGIGGIGTSDFDAVLNTGTVYQLVTTGFANGDEGAFDNTITCGGAIVSLGIPDPVPTLGETAMMILAGLTALLALVVLNRRRKSGDDGIGGAAA